MQLETVQQFKNDALKQFSGYIRQLRELQVTKDEIVSDINYTILTCHSNFKSKFGASFKKYLFTSIENNFKRKIYAIRAKQATEYPLEYSLLSKEKSPLSEALSETPELFEYAICDISDSDFISSVGNTSLAMRSLNVIEDHY